jgi:hypothetical protein
MTHQSFDSNLIFQNVVNLNIGNGLKMTIVMRQVGFGLRINKEGGKWKYFNFKMDPMRQMGD